MKKSLIALAVAGTFAAPAAFAATANVDIYGVIKMSYDYVDTDSSRAGEDDNLSRISSNSSRIGFKGSEDLGGGLKAIWQWESQIAADANAAGITNRNTFIGLNGGFGTVLAGTHDTPYKLSTGRLDVFVDTMGDYNTIIGSGGGANVLDLRTSNTIAYISPNMSGFSVAAAYVFANEAGNDGAKNSKAYSLSGSYSNGPLFATLAYEDHKNMSPGTGITAADRDGFKAGVGYSFGDTKLGLVYETIDSDNKAEERSAWLVNVAHAMGPITLKASYGRAGNSDAPGGSDGATNYVLGADYAMSKRTKVYALYAKTDNKSVGRYAIGGAGAGGIYRPGTFPLTGSTDGAAGNDPSVFSIGMEHSF